MSNSSLPSSLVLLLAIITMLASSPSTVVVHAATSSFHHDLSPPLKDFTAPRAFLAQRFAARKAQEQQLPQTATTTAASSHQQWAVRGGAATDGDDTASSLLASSSSSCSFHTTVTSDMISSASTITLQEDLDIGSIESPSLGNSNNAVMNLLVKVSAVALAESVLFAGSHLEPLGRQLGATVAQRWRPTLAAVGRHSKFLAGVALGLIVVR